MEPVMEFEAFCREHGSFMQSPSWANVKPGWIPERVTVRRGGQIVGAMLILVRPLPLLKTAFLYAPRGPVCNLHDRKVLAELLDRALDVAESYHAFGMKIDPLIDEDDDAAIRNLTALGFRWAPDKVGYDNIQCRENYILDLRGKTQEDLLAGFDPKCRYNIRLAGRRGVTCGFYGEERLNDFMALMRTTAERDGFAARSREYFAGLLRSFRGQARLCMTYLDGEPLSGALCIEYAGTMSYVYGCSSNEHRDCMPNYLMQWTMIRRACEEGMTTYDFCGVPYWYDTQHKNYGVYRFKSGFRGSVKTWAGEFDYTLRPVLQYIFNAAWFLKKRVLCRIAGLSAQRRYAAVKTKIVPGRGLA